MSGCSESYRETLRDDRVEAERLEIGVDVVYLLLQIGLCCRIADDRAAVGWSAGVAGASGEGQIELWRANVLEADLEGEAEVAAAAGDHIAKTNGEAGSDMPAHRE